MWDLVVEQYSTWNRSVLNHLYGDCPVLFQAINQENPTGQLHIMPYIAFALYVNLLIFIFVIILMSACHSLRSHSPLKTVFGKIGDTYQTYCHTYKTHTMATCHGGSGQPLDGDINAHKDTDTDIEQTQDFHHVNTNDFEESDPNNPARLTLITRELDDLYQWIQAGEGQPLEVLNCIEHELQRLSISLHPSAPPEPLEDMLKQYRKSMSYPKADKLHKQFHTGYTYLQWKWCHTTRGLVSGHWACSQSVSWKQDKTCLSQVKRTNSHFYYRSSYLR